MTDVRKAYSYDEEMYNYDTVDEAVESLINHDWKSELKIGDTVTIYEGEVVKQKPSNFTPTADWILEDMEERASWNCGEASDGFTYCSQEKKDELQKLLDEWVDANLKCHFYGIKNSKPLEVVLTKEHFD